MLLHQKIHSSDLFEPAEQGQKNSATAGPSIAGFKQRMSKKKVRAGHRGFLTGVLPDVDDCLHNYEAEKKVELAKWHTVLKEQLDKILPLDEEIYAELIADE